MACIVLITNQSTWVQWSEEFKIPSNEMKNCIRDEVVYKVWSDLKDPHSEFTKGLKPRATFLKDALLEIKPKLSF